MKRRETQAVTQEEVSAALARFLKQGGMIQKLPDQNFHATERVGGEKYDAYERLADLPSLTVGGEQPA
jgi:hypothetical protein